MKKVIYLLAAVAGFAVPWYFFLAFLLENGPDLGLFIQYLLANQISVFFAADLIIVALATLFYTVVRRAQAFELALVAVRGLHIGNWAIVFDSALPLPPRTSRK